ncbi:MAG TPA: GntR family transcriptional regulator [Syntrophorhabdaceae bacterium]|nr:GntR family transcriptional regulator [Syntrophorhabdaceae bacterium]
MTVDRGLFKPLPSKRAFDQIADQIKQLIYSKQFQPGDKLPPERELAAQFKSSRMAVREAFRMLEQSGLIYVRHGSDGGAFVKEADSSVVIESISDLVQRGNLTIENLREARAGIDRLIIQAAVERINEEEMRTLKESVEESEKILSRKPEGRPPFDFEALVLTFRRFHFVIAKATKNPFFEVIVQAIMGATRFVINEQTISHRRLKSHLILHKELYEALKSKDLSLVLRTMAEHEAIVENNYPSARQRRGARLLNTATRRLKKPS